MRFVANVTTGEVHDLTRVCASCRVSKIRNRRDANSVEELKLKLGERLKLHPDCFKDTR
jgi:antitoxin component HigA of HigAB toxin-antitoxin module